ncbi:MAG TPA: S8 family peptidase [Solirubrobacteraceae bacterium]|jgi:subtilisin family serine protease|nr:S8 family peptidase [Solirubrobacteraceae bacterium]
MRARRLIGVSQIAWLALWTAPATASAAQPAAADVAGQYIVVMKPGSGEAGRERSQHKARDRGGAIRRNYASALKGFVAKLPATALAAVAADPDVAYVEPDRLVSLSDTQTSAPWGLDRIDQRNLPVDGSYTYPGTGAGVTAYVIDSGIRMTHEEFGGRAVTGIDTIDGGAADDCNGHGTHVAGILGGSTYGVAKQVKLVAVRVTGCADESPLSNIIAGIDWVTADHVAGQPAVANLSLGISRSPALDEAASNSIADGVVYAVASGNGNEATCDISPARVPAALTTAATTDADARASYSNYGTCIDVFAPGSSITSAWFTSDSATKVLSGTSMSTPAVAGVAALILQGSPSASPATVASTLTSNATTGIVTNPGAGTPNRLLYSPPSGGASPPPPPPSPPPPPPPPGSACGLAESYAGTLSGSGAGDSLPPPDGTYTAAAGEHRGCLRGPAGADFDLYLKKLSGGAWTTVAQSTTKSTSTESVTYAGTAGSYRWRVLQRSGSGAYTFELSRPGATPPPPPPAVPPPPVPPPPPPAGCALTQTFTGTLSGTGSSAGVSLPPPTGQYTSMTNGEHRGCLRGPAGTNFDLTLKKLDASGTWQVVAQSTSAGSTEDVTYSGTPGTYRWRVVSSTGKGAYTFGLSRPT